MIQSEPRTALDATARHWYARTNAVEHAHFERCAKFRKWHLWLGCITISCTAVLGVIADKHMTGPSWFQHLHDHLLPWCRGSSRPSRAPADRGRTAGRMLAAGDPRSASARGPRPSGLPTMRSGPV